MEFDLSEEQRMIRGYARELAEHVVAPGGGGRERRGAFPLAEFKAAAERGFAGILCPEEFGGSALGNMALSLVLVEVNAACASVGVTLSVHNSLCSAPLVKFGN